MNFIVLPFSLVNVYVVTVVDYEFTRIDSVFLSKESAEARRDELKRADTATVPCCYDVEEEPIVDYYRAVTTHAITV